MNLRRLARQTVGLVVASTMMLALAGCPGGQPGIRKVKGPPADSRYLGVAILASESASVKSERVATKNGARVDFYLLNLTDLRWKATVAFPKVPQELAICNPKQSNITNVELSEFGNTQSEFDATARCQLHEKDVKRYCGWIDPPTGQDAATVQAAPGTQTTPAVEAAPRAVCEIDYTITFTSSSGDKKVVDPKLEIER